MILFFVLLGIAAADNNVPSVLNFSNPLNFFPNLPNNFSNLPNVQNLNLGDLLEKFQKIAQNFDFNNFPSSFCPNNTTITLMKYSQGTDGFEKKASFSVSCNDSAGLVVERCKNLINSSGFNASLVSRLIFNINGHRVMSNNTKPIKGFPFLCSTEVCIVTVTMTRPQNEIAAPREFDLLEEIKKIKISPEDLQSATARRVQERINRFNASFASVMKDKLDDALNFNINTENAPEIKFSKPGASANIFRYQFAKIKFFVPQNPELGWQGNAVENNVIASFSLNDADGSVKKLPINCSSTTDVFFTCAQTFLDANDNNLVRAQILSQIASTTFTKNNTVFSPRSLKITVIINAPELPTNGYIALILNHRMPRGLEPGRIEGLGLNLGGNESRFDWEGTFLDDTGVEAPVLFQKTFVSTDDNVDTSFDATGTPADMEDGRFAFTFGKAGTTSVFWDPSVSDGASSNGDAAFWSTGAIVGVAVGAFVLVAIIAAFVVKRKNNNHVGARN